MSWELENGMDKRNLSRLCSKYQLVYIVDSRCTGCDLIRPREGALVVRVDVRVVFLCASCCAELERDGWDPETNEYFLALMYGGTE